LFLGSGSVINGMHHEQDMRRMGGLKRLMPITHWTMFAAWLAICGLILYCGGLFPPGCTAFYMTRLMAMTFWTKARFGEAHDADATHDAHGFRGHHGEEAKGQAANTPSH